METKFCPSCKTTKPLTEFYSNGRTTAGNTKRKPTCGVCEHLYRRNQMIKLMMEYLSTRNNNYNCEICGDTDDYGFLEFHHVNPKDKDFDIASKAFSWGIDKWVELLIPELDKCILLCPNCHKREHLKLRKQAGDVTVAMTALEAVA
jgi:5-methylcytosine-specific restriction endonuclease McrA